MIIKVKFLKEIEYAGELIEVSRLAAKPKLPKYSKREDACMDVYAIAYEYDSKNDRYIYHTGLAFDTRDKTSLGKMTIRPRSNLTKSDWYIPNSPCTLDAGYRGELLICFKNRTSNDLISIVEMLVNNLESSSIKDRLLTLVHTLIKKQDPPYYPINDDCRIAQIEVEPINKIIWEVVTDLSETDRGAGGFGSTGSAAK